MASLNKGLFGARFARSKADIHAAQALRSLCFRKGEGVDQDEFDPHCQHVLIENLATNTVVGCCRLLPLKNGHEVDRSYSAQFYDLSALHDYTAPLVELGRFCIAPHVGEARISQDTADIVRLAWGLITKYVDDQKIGMLFGCSSFQGIDNTKYAHSFAVLKARHVATHQWQPKVKSKQIVRFSDLAPDQVDYKQAMANMPPLLRTYLIMGGWVSGHAVVDRDLDTLHVFTGLEIGKVPSGRARLLRNVSREAG